MGIVGPGAPDLASFQQMLIEGKSAISFIPELKEYNLYCQIAGKAERDEKKYKEIFEYFEIEGKGDNIELACHAGIEAWLDAGFEVPTFEAKETDWDTGMIIGSGMSNIEYIVENVAKAVHNKTIRKLSSQTVPCCMGSGASAYLSNILAISNQVTANSSACCTGSEAIIDAYYKIKIGLAERMLAGGSEGFSVAIYSMFDAARVSNRKFNAQPKMASRPMSESARGFVPSSGAGILMLESLESALERGVRIYAELIGGAVNSGGQRNGGSMTFPNNEGVQRCIRKAIEQAGIKLEDIDLINGHLTATKADPMEIKNWVKVFEKSKEGFPLINSTKSMVGHLLGAAGSIESIACILQLNKGFVHPSINCEDIHPVIQREIGQGCIPQTIKEKRDLNIIIKSSFGFGDVNTTIIFKKWID